FRARAKRMATAAIAGKPRTPILITNHVELQTTQSVNHATGTPHPTLGRQLCFDRAFVAFIYSSDSGRTVATALAAAKRLLLRAGRVSVFYIERAIRTPLVNPIRCPFLVKRGDPFTRFSRFAGLHVILERKIDIFSHRTPLE